MNAAFFVVVVSILAFVFVLFWKPLVGVVFIHFLGFVVVHVFCKPTEEQTLRLKINHGGMFIYNPFIVYVNGHIVDEEWG